MDPTSVATALVPLFSQALPYLLKAGESAAEEAGKELGGGVWSWAKGLWSTLQPSLEKRSGVMEAIHEVAKNERDPDAVALLRFHLKQLFTENPDLLEEVGPFVKRAEALDLARDQSKVTIGDNANISGYVAGRDISFGRPH